MTFIPPAGTVMIPRALSHGFQAGRRLLMQRYRVVIMQVRFGLLPVGAALFAALSFLEEEPPQAEVAPAAEAHAYGESRNSWHRR